MMKSLLSLAAVLAITVGSAAGALAQTAPAATAATAAPSAPRFEFVYEARVKLGQLVRTSGHTYAGSERGTMSLLGGTFEGPRLRGTVLPTSHDWPIFMGNGVRAFETGYVFLTDDGERLFIRVNGFRYDPAALKGPQLESEQVDPPPNNLRVAVQIQAPDTGRYAWLTHNLYIGVAGPLVRGPEPMTTLRVYRVL